MYAPVSVKGTKEIKKIICNKCGREIQVVNGCPREGVFSVDQTWGYFSRRTVNTTVLICVNRAMTSF